MTTSGHAKQPTELQETGQEKEGDKTEDEEMNKVPSGELLGYRQRRTE